VCLGRKTLWVEGPAGVFSGLGQRVLTTDNGEHALMDVRSITIGNAANDGVAATAHA
jgi:type VI secretion system protein ImpE